MDVGGLWGTVNEKVSVACKAGAASATMLDITPLDRPLWADFRARLGDLGVEDYSCVSASIDDPEALSGVGRFDVVHCSGVLYHVPNPVHTLSQLRGLAGSHLILTSVVVPDRIETDSGEIDLSGGRLIFVPHLPARELQILSDHFDNNGIQGAIGIQSPAERWDPADYAPWWWLFTRQVLRQLALSVGFDVLDEGDHWDGRAYCLLLERR